MWIEGCMDGGDSRIDHGRRGEGWRVGGREREQREREKQKDKRREAMNKFIYQLTILS